MKKLVVLLLAILVASSAFAVVDPDPNSIGIYFDLTADLNNNNPVPNVPFNAYLILTNTDAPSVSAYEVGYEIVVPVGMEGLLFRLGSSITNGEVSGLDLGDSSDILAGDHIVGLASPLVAGPATVLHSWQYMFTTNEVKMTMFISSASQSSLPGIYPVILNAETSTLFNAYNSTGLQDGGPRDDMANAVCFVNFVDPEGELILPVATEELSFGSLKSLFR